MRQSGFRYGLMLLLLLTAAALSIGVRQGRAGPLRKDFAQFPITLGEWQGASLGEFPEGILKVLQVSDYLNRVYRRGDDQLFLYIGYYRNQRAGESVHSPKNCLPGEGWEVLESRRAPLEIPAAGKTIEVNHYVVQNGQNRQFVLYWYDTHGRAFASEYKGKAILVWEALRTGRTDGAMIRILAPFATSPARAEALASEFARQVYPALKEYLPE